MSSVWRPNGLGELRRWQLKIALLYVVVMSGFVIATSRQPHSIWMSISTLFAGVVFLMVLFGPQVRIKRRLRELCGAMCYDCGYEMETATGARCSECGHVHTEKQRLALIHNAGVLGEQQET